MQGNEIHVKEYGEMQITCVCIGALLGSTHKQKNTEHKCTITHIVEATAKKQFEEHTERAEPNTWTVIAAPVKEEAVRYSRT